MSYCILFTDAPAVRCIPIAYSFTQNCEWEKISMQLVYLLQTVVWVERKWADNHISCLSFCNKQPLSNDWKTLRAYPSISINLIRACAKCLKTDRETVSLQTPGLSPEVWGMYAYTQKHKQTHMTTRSQAAFHIERIRDRASIFCFQRKTLFCDCRVIVAAGLREDWQDKWPATAEMLCVRAACAYYLHERFGD